MNAIRQIIPILLISATALFFECSDNPPGSPPPKYYSEMNTGVWSDKADTHLPQIRRLEGNRIEVRVAFSPTLKPLHYVESIVLMRGEKTVVEQKKFEPSVSIPIAEFDLPDSKEPYWVVSKCNLHDMWKADVK
jgi:desulfoferrodoxin (superoxide reductase-like protein)